jgi:hypothetical protein
MWSYYVIDVQMPYFLFLESIFFIPKIFNVDQQTTKESVIVKIVVMMRQKHYLWKLSSDEHE